MKRKNVRHGEKMPIWFFCSPEKFFISLCSKRPLRAKISRCKFVDRMMYWRCGPVGGDGLVLRAKFSIASKLADRGFYLLYNKRNRCIYSVWWQVINYYYMQRPLGHPGPEHGEIRVQNLIGSNRLWSNKSCGQGQSFRISNFIKIRWKMSELEQFKWFSPHGGHFWKTFVKKFFFTTKNDYS